MITYTQTFLCTDLQDIKCQDPGGWCGPRGNNDCQNRRGTHENAQAKVGHPHVDDELWCLSIGLLCCLCLVYCLGCGLWGSLHWDGRRSSSGGGSGFDRGALQPGWFSGCSRRGRCLASRARTTTSATLREYSSVVWYV